MTIPWWNHSTCQEIIHKQRCNVAFIRCMEASLAFQASCGLVGWVDDQDLSECLYHVRKTAWLISSHYPNQMLTYPFSALYASCQNFSHYLTFFFFFNFKIKKSGFYFTFQHMLYFDLCSLVRFKEINYSIIIIILAYSRAVWLYDLIFFLF